MSEALSLAEIDGQHVELLPVRTVLSGFTSGFFFIPDFDDANININTNENTATATATVNGTAAGTDGTAPAPTDPTAPALF